MIVGTIEVTNSREVTDAPWDGEPTAAFVYSGHQTMALKMDLYWDAGHEDLMRRFVALVAEVTRELPTRALLRDTCATPDCHETDNLKQDGEAAYCEEHR